MTKHSLCIKIFPLLSLGCFQISEAQQQAGQAVVIGVSAAGVGYVTYSDTINGIDAQIGRWDTPYTGGVNGPPIPGLEPLGASILNIDVDVNNGGLASFDYTFKTYDAGIYNWYDIYLATPTGRINILNRLGKPGNDYGTFYSSPKISKSVSLDQWRNQRVTFVFLVMQDGWGDQSQGEVIGFDIRTCPIVPLTPITDPVALQFEGGQTVNINLLQPNMQTSLACLQTAVANAGGTLNVTSAYRPPAYQAHLQEVWYKWDSLKYDSSQECQELKSEVQAEFQKHGLLSSQPPASSNGLHTQGKAIDMTSSLPMQAFLPLATQCQLTRPLPVSDPVHFVHQ